MAAHFRCALRETAIASSICAAGVRTISPIRCSVAGSITSRDELARAPLKAPSIKTLPLTPASAAVTSLISLPHSFFVFEAS